MSEKRIVNVEFSADFYEWLSGFSQQVRLPMDKTLVTLAMAGVDHMNQCEKIIPNPAAYRRRLEQPQ